MYGYARMIRVVAQQCKVCFIDHSQALLPLHSTNVGDYKESVLRRRMMVVVFRARQSGRARDLMVYHKKVAMPIPHTQWSTLDPAHAYDYLRPQAIVYRRSVNFLDTSHEVRGTVVVKMSAPRCLRIAIEACRPCKV